MLTISELARSLGYSRQYMQRCVKEGCPLGDFESARLWHAANRPNSKKSPKTDLDDEPARPKRLDTDDQWAPTTGTLEEALESSVRACKEAWKLLDEAFIEGKPSKIGMWLSLHNKAVEARVKVERMIREELERQKTLIPMVEAKTLVRRIAEIVVSRLGAMPQNIAPRCNPHAPEHAMEILQEECASIISDAQKAAMI